MAVEKMHFMSIVGLIDQLDDFVVSNIAPFDIQLVDAYDTMDSLKGVYKFSEENRYEKLISKIRKLVMLSGKKFTYDPNKVKSIITVDEMEQKIAEIEEKVEELSKKQQILMEEKKHKEKLLYQLKPLSQFKVDIDRMFRFRHFKFRYGKMPIDSYRKLREYSDDLDVIVYRVSTEDDFAYVMYFTTISQELNIDSLFSSLSFERIWISDDISGQPYLAVEQYRERLKIVDQQLKTLESEALKYTEIHLEELEEYYHNLVKLNNVFDVRKYAIHTVKAFYLAGWIPDSQINRFKSHVKITSELSYVIEDESAVNQNPPTKLSNPKFFKPFETIVKMYGVPAYGEFDPTIFVGITYMLLFGIMFGDVGQGLVIALAGYFLSKRKGIEPAKLLMYFGSMSILFGIVYGSVFGNEEILRHYLHFIPMINPMEVKMELLGASVIFGVFLLLAAMVINLYNLWNNKDIGRFLFDKNGITGLVFYISILYLILSVVLKKNISIWYVIILIIGPMIILFLSERLAHKMNHKHHKSGEELEHSPSVIESFFELVELLLSVFSNTISFVRVGAFALNHVGFFLAFHQLGKMVGGAGSIVVMIFGNILIILLEGLIVGIQGLRLEYYELFSRFYKGTGKEFKPFRIKD